MYMGADEVVWSIIQCLLGSAGILVFKTQVSDPVEVPTPIHHTDTCQQTPLTHPLTHIATIVIWTYNSPEKFGLVQADDK